MTARSMWAQRDADGNAVGRDASGRFAPRLAGETLEALRARLAPLDTPEARAAYMRGDFPRADAVRDLTRRYRWDLFAWAQAWSLLPEGVTDAHIETALRRIIPPLASGREGYV